MKKNLNQKICIIGAGPAGLVAAYELQKKGFKVSVFESSDSVGGMTKTFPLWGKLVDVGPHRFFSNDPRVNKVWFELVGEDYVLINRITRIFYKNKYLNYPLEPFNTLLNLGFLNSLKAVTSFFFNKVCYPFKKENLTFESWVISQFGNYLYKEFFKGYSEKLWGLKGDKLDSDFAIQRIKKISFKEVVKKAIFNRVKENQTFVTTFAYPKFGAGMPYERIANILKKSGSLFLNKPVKSLLFHENKVSGVRFSDGTEDFFDFVISSMPLTKLVKGIPNLPLEIFQSINKLKFRNTILVYLLVKGDCLFSDQWLYIHDQNLKMGRISNFNNWSPNLRDEEKTSILAIEYWASNNDEFWKLDDSVLIELAKIELLATKLIKSETVMNGYVLKVPNSYPIYENGYKVHLKTVKTYLNSFDNLIPIGRYGAFKYNNQDHSILMGIMASEIIAASTGSDVWSVNSVEEGYIEDHYFS